MSDVTVSRGIGADVPPMLDEMVEVYARVYAEPPYLSGDPENCAAFVERTTGQADRPGFSVVWCRDGERLVGFAFGLPLGPGGWWRGEATPPPAEIQAGDKFAVIELILDAAYRGRGLGRTMMDTLLADRPEPYALLTAVPEAPARQIYARWGWQQIGTAHHAPTMPVMDQLILKL